MKKKEHVKLSETEQAYLEDLISKGSLPVKTYRRAQALLLLNQGETYTAVSQTVGVTKQTVSVWAKNYRESGLQFLADKPRPGRPKKILSVDEAAITALACSDPPEGYDRWTLRLLADRLVTIEVIDSISHVAVGNALKKMNSSLG